MCTCANYINKLGTSITPTEPPPIEATTTDTIEATTTEANATPSDESNGTTRDESNKLFKCIFYIFFKYKKIKNKKKLKH